MFGSSMQMNRRHFIKTTGLSLAATLLYEQVFSGSYPEPIAFINLPDEVSAIVNNQLVTLVRSGDFWIYQDVAISFENTKSSIVVFIQGPGVSLSEVTLLWQTSKSKITVLNDQWERTYGDASWHPLKDGERFPWYFLEHSEAGTSGLGIKTGAATFVPGVLTMVT